MQVFEWVRDVFIGYICLKVLINMAVYSKRRLRFEWWVVVGEGANP